ncbi:hypothetical protein K439DRAFT_1621449 [Ramaria rubella]|nr:hypothetical protein K439DRAFT_1623168 [Ramaria rubella]KAF8578258.1 hypothetical protein K439DRAFT_1621449 [Ramaria rubella]
MSSATTSSKASSSKDVHKSKSKSPPPIVALPSMSSHLFNLPQAKNMASLPVHPTQSAQRHAESEAKLKKALERNIARQNSQPATLPSQQYPVRPSSVVVLLRHTICSDVPDADADASSAPPVLSAAHILRAQFPMLTFATHHDEFPLQNKIRLKGPDIPYPIFHLPLFSWVPDSRLYCVSVTYVPPFPYHIMPSHHVLRTIAVPLHMAAVYLFLADANLNRQLHD